MKKILVVDDDKLLRESIAKELSDSGYQVIQAGDGEAGYAAAEANAPDLVITDVVMPKLDGLSMLQKIKKTTWGKNLASVVLTIKDADIENVNKSMETGAAAYLSKSDISREQLMAVVEQQLQKYLTP